MGCIFSKREEILIKHPTNPEFGLYVTLFESNIEYINPIHNDTPSKKRITI